MNEIDRRLLENAAVAMYDLKESVDRLIAVAENLDRTMTQRAACKNCGHELTSHILTPGVQQGQCLSIGCGCIHYEPAAT